MPNEQGMGLLQVHPFFYPQKGLYSQKGLFYTIKVSQYNISYTVLSKGSISPIINICCHI